MDLSNWLNPQHIQKKTIQDYKKRFLNNSPFPHLEIHDFLKEEKILSLIKALEKEEFLEKESDLFKFMQTHDFATTDNLVLQELRSFLSSKEFLSFMKDITELPLKEESIDLSSSLYQNTDYLLPHDDRLEGRKIAFMLYLSTLNEKDGGKLIFYKTKGSIPREEEKAIIPKRNTFVFFKVSEKSFHEVEEVITNTQRITIGGWFHGAYDKLSVSQERKY